MCAVSKLVLDIQRLLQTYAGFDFPSISHKLIICPLFFLQEHWSSFWQTSATLFTNRKQETSNAFIAFRDVFSPTKHSSWVLDHLHARDKPTLTSYPKHGNINLEKHATFRERPAGSSRNLLPHNLDPRLSLLCLLVVEKEARGGEYRYANPPIRAFFAPNPSTRQYFCSIRNHNTS